MTFYPTFEGHSRGCSALWQQPPSRLAGVAGLASLAAGWPMRSFSLMVCIRDTQRQIMHITKSAAAGLMQRCCSNTF